MKKMITLIVGAILFLPLHLAGAGLNIGKPSGIGDRDWELLQQMIAELQQQGFTIETPSSSDMSRLDQWSRIKVSDGKVVELDLYRCHPPYESGEGYYRPMTTPIVPTIFLFPDVRRINIEGKSFSGNLEEVLETALVSNPSLANNLKELVINGNPLTGNLGGVARLLPSLTLLNAYGCGFDRIDPMIKRSVQLSHMPDLTSGNHSVDIYLTGPTAISDMIAQLPSIFFYDHENQCFHLDGSNIDSYIIGEYPTGQNYITVEIDYFGDPYFQPYDFRLPDNVATVLRVGDEWTGGKINATVHFLEGDVNVDLVFDILDVQSAIRAILAPFEYIYSGGYDVNRTAVDINHDSSVDVLDVVTMVNLLAVRPVEVGKRNVKGVGSKSLVRVEGDKLVVSSGKSVAAFDIALTSAPAIETIDALKKTGMSARIQHNPDGTMRIIAYSTAGKTLPAGETILCTGISGASIASAMLADADGHQIVETAEQAAVETVNLAASECVWTLYSIDGSLVASGAGLWHGDGSLPEMVGNVPHGFYIVKIENNNTMKTIKIAL